MAARKIIKKTHYLIGNRHTGAIVIPRKNKDRLVISKVEPIILPPGQTTSLDSEEWKDLKAANKMIQVYLEKGLLSEEQKSGSVPVSDQTVDSFPIPDHLLREEESGKSTDTKAKIVRKNVTVVNA